MHNDYEYSEKEVALIRHFFPHLTITGYYKNIVPLQLYNMMPVVAFSNNDKTIFADSLRNCVRALEKSTIDKGKIYRMTPEWDALIDDRVLGTTCFCTLSNEYHDVTEHSCCEVCDMFNSLL